MVEEDKSYKEILKEYCNKEKVFLIIIVLLFVFVSLIIFSNQFNKKSLFETQAIESQPLTLEQKFAKLSVAKTNFCAKSDFIDSLSEDDRLQGSCCSKMDFHRYKEQVEGLKKYSYTSVIPSDPYDISISLAKELLNYQKNIQLNEEQQKIYDGAMKMSHEGGPCCCKCWRWDAFEGQAKYLIVEKGFIAEQVAEVWDLEDGCGGSGHVEGEEH
ncbi:MAG: hypothetical protein AABW90_00430 [Nanoarchaeota archaeon]